MSDEIVKLDRRDFVRLLTAGAAGEALIGATTPAEAGTTPPPPEIVIVGGGMAGTTCAKYLSYWGKMANKRMNITLIDRNVQYVSNILSNGVLVGERSISSLTYSYTKLTSLSTADIPIKVINDEVLSIDPLAKTVTLKGAGVVTATRLVLAPGIDFDYSNIQILGGSVDLLPHAWDASIRIRTTTGSTTQTSVLQSQLSSMTDGQIVAIIIPKVPYRCPPGPYERACVIADWMKKAKPRSKVVILDANDGIVAEPINFGNAFGLNPAVKGIHAGYVQYFPKMTVQSIEFDVGKTPANTKTIKGVDANGTPFTLTAQVVNLIPGMKASRLITSNFAPGALSGGRWALVNELTYESTYYVDQNVNYKGVHIIGDSIASKQPKAGHIGNQEAKICADAIIRLETGAPFTSPPMTNSACFTPITTKVGPTGQTATWLTALYRGQVVPEKNADGSVKLNADGSVKIATDNSGQKVYAMSMTSTKPYEPLSGASEDNFDSMTKWFTALMQDVSFA